jgi:endonuclease VIII
VPEGHLAHRYAGRMAPLVGDPVVVTSPQARVDTAAVDGLRLVVVEAHGKHLLHRVPGWALHTHLGMQGTWAELPSPPPPAKPQCRIRVSGPAATWDLFAPQTAEVLDDDGVERLLARLGPDPLRGDDPTPTLDALADDDRPIGEALLDQALFAGVGNVLRAEALAACGIHPRTPSSAADLRCLWDDLVVRMAEARDAGEIAKHVYKQEACDRCGTGIEHFDLPRGRTAWACPSCQPAAA